MFILEFIITSTIIAIACQQIENAIKEVESERNNS